MKITVIGAAGRLGQRVVEEAARRGHQVTALARHPEHLARPELLAGIAAGDGRDRDVVAGAVAGADAVVSALPGGMRKDPHQAADATRAVTAAMRDHGVDRLVMTSAYPIVGTVRGPPCGCCARCSPPPTPTSPKPSRSPAPAV